MEGAGNDDAEEAERGCFQASRLDMYRMLAQAFGGSEASTLHVSASPKLLTPKWESQKERKTTLDARVLGLQKERQQQGRVADVLIPRCTIGLIDKLTAAGEG